MAAVGTLRERYPTPNEDKLDADKGRSKVRDDGVYVVDRSPRDSDSKSVASAWPYGLYGAALSRNPGRSSTPPEVPNATLDTMRGWDRMSMWLARSPVRATVSPSVARRRNRSLAPSIRVVGGYLSPMRRGVSNSGCERRGAPEMSDDGRDSSSASRAGGAPIDIPSAAASAAGCVIRYCSLVCALPWVRIQATRVSEERARPRTMSKLPSLE